MWSKAQRLRPGGASSHMRWRPATLAETSPPDQGPADADPTLRVNEADGPSVEAQCEEAYQRGCADGRAEASAALVQERERLASTVREIAALRRQVLASAERDVLQLAVGMARRVLHREVQLDPDILLSMAHVALRRLGPRVAATVHLHPADLAAISTATALPEGLTLLADAELPRGGCRLVAPNGEIDLGVDAQVTELSRVLLGESREVAHAHLH